VKPEGEIPCRHHLDGCMEHQANYN
jgi:hypothetical protein